MTDRIRYIWQLFVLSISLFILGILIIPDVNADLSLNHYYILLFAVTFINLIAFLVMIRGIRKGEREGTFILLAGIGLKFLLYLLMIMVFWLVTKNLDKPFIIAFFALYLVFTILLAGHLYKALKNN